MEEKYSKTFWVRIYMAGNIDDAKQFIRLAVWKKPNCFNIFKTDYIYTGGEESGFCIELINYAKFPKQSKDIVENALDIAMGLLNHLGQKSCTIQDPEVTRFYTRESEIKN